MIRQSYGFRLEMGFGKGIFDQRGGGMFRTYEIPGVFDELDPNEPVLRYLNLVKFFDLIETRSLYFADPVALNDEREGEVGLYNHQLRPRVYADTPVLLEQLPLMDQFAKRYALISSWSISEKEDFLMSSTYGAPPPCIVVHSTWGALQKSLLGDTPVYGGPVRYTDIDINWTAENTVFHRHMQKRERFQGERELRLLIAAPDHTLQNPDRRAMGRKVEVDIDTLLNSVSVVGDFLRSTTANAIKSYLDIKGISVPVQEVS